MNPTGIELLQARRRDEPSADARRIYDRLLADGALADPARVYSGYADLADLHYKNGERYQALSVLEEYRDRFLDQADAFLANKIRNKIEFLGGKTVLESKPLKLEIALLDQCNLRCTMCLQTSFGEHEISDERHREILDLIPYLEVVNWIGGEVFLSPHFEPLFDAAARVPRIRQHIITNGLKIDARWAEKLARGNVSLLVSIDAFTAPSYERIRKGARFESLLSALTHLQRAFAAFPPPPGNPEPLALNFILMRQNLEEAASICEFAARYGFSAVQISSLLPFQPSEEYEKQNVEFDPGLSRRFVEVIKPRIEASSRATGVRVRHMPAFTRQAPARPGPAPKFSLDATLLTCPYPWGSLFADAKGDAKPFCLCGTFPAGNIHRDPVAAVWNGEGMRRYRALADVNANDDLLCRRCDMANYRFEMKLLDPLW